LPLIKPKDQTTMSKIFFVGTGLILIIFISNSDLPLNMMHAAKEQIRKIFWDDNFHVVDKENLYRCRQLSDTKLEQYIKQYNIKTVLNLRRYDEEPKIRKKEQEACKKNNILFFAVPMDGKTEISECDLKQLIAILETTPRPIIVHCFAGADRTGTICALYKLLTGNTTVEALEQLTVRYSHFSWLEPVFTKIIRNIENAYPNLITSMKKHCSKYRFSTQELEGLDAHQLLAKIIDS